jgi:predicted exporter
MMPKPFEEESLKKANETLMKKLSKAAIVLSADKDFEKAKAGAERIYEKLSKSPYFVSVLLNTDTVDIREIAGFFHKYRFDLLDDETIKAIENGGAEDFAQEAVSRIYSPFTMLPLDDLNSDPFMLAEHNLQKYLEVLEHSGTALRPKDGVLAAEKNGLWYVMIKTELSPEGAALASKDNGITEIYDICGKIKAETGTRCVVSGGTFHSHKSSNSASEEIKIISIISITIVILMLLFVFRSATPIILSLLSIFFSLFSAAALTFAVFGKVHLVTLVFGTSLIGSSIDYSLHYFVHASGNPNLRSGSEIRSKLLPGLTMAIISSSVCFLALIFAPFNLLKQMSLFSVTGLVSSFLTTTAIFPYVPLPKNRVVRGVTLFEKGFALAKKINGIAAI